MMQSRRPKHWPKANFAPRYDSIVDTGPEHNCDYTPTYWIDTAGPAPDDDGPVSEDFDADVARLMHAEISPGFELFPNLVSNNVFDYDPQEGGHYYIAHKPGVIPRLDQRFSGCDFHSTACFRISSCNTRRRLLNAEKSRQTGA